MCARCFRSAAAADPTKAEAHAALGFSLDRGQDTPAADLSYERALALGDDPAAQLYAGRGVLARFIRKSRTSEVGSGGSELSVGRNCSVVPAKPTVTR